MAKWEEKKKENGKRQMEGECKVEPWGKRGVNEGGG